MLDWLLVVPRLFILTQRKEVGMECSFDMVRKNLVGSFNRLARDGESLTARQRGELEYMRNQVVALICMYDPKNQPDDCNALSDLDVVEVGGRSL